MVQRSGLDATDGRGAGAPPTRRAGNEEDEKTLKNEPLRAAPAMRRSAGLEPAFQALGRFTLFALTVESCPET